MTNLSTELARLAEAATPVLSTEIIPDLNNIVRALEDEGDRVYLGSTNDAERLREIADWIERHLRDFPFPAIIAAIKAAETPLGDYAGLVERLRFELRDWNGKSRFAFEKVNALVIAEAADAIEALTRQLGERETENAAMCRIIYAYVDPCDVRQDDEAFVLGIARSQALGGDNG